MKKSIFLLPFLLLTIAGICQQPTKAELEKQRAAIQREIDEVRSQINQTAKNKKATLGQLSLVQKKLRLRMAAINTINKQIGLIQGDIYQSNRDIYKLKKELDTLRMQYEKSVVYAYKNRSNYDFLNFLFSSTSFNDALKRIAYLRSYRNYREQQAATIRNTQELLKQKLAGLNENKKKKGEALEEENKQRGVLEEEKNEKNQVIASLKSREKELNKELAAKRKRDKRLTVAINEAVRRAREEAIREAKAKAEAAKREAAAVAKAAGKTTTNPATTNPSTTIKTPDVATPATPKSSTLFDSRADVALSDNFEKNKKNLPWPVDNGSVAVHFGVYTIEGTDIRGNNLGITIETDAGKSVKAIFDGEVQSVFSVGDVSAIMIRHGKYFTTYSNLGSVSVSKGQQIKIGQVIGKVSDIGQLEFVLSDEKDHKFDPEKWLR